MRKVLLLLISVGICLCRGSPIIGFSDQPSSFTIDKSWDGIPVAENEKIQFTLEGVPNSRDIIWRIDAPFYDDPPPPGEPGEPFLGLWDYEVVEVFFLNDKDQYLEVEVAPQGQQIVLLLNGERNTIRHSLPLDVKTEIKGQKWTGNATIPGDYFPPQVTKLNAYAIHGVDEDRKYLALYPADGSTSAPDFHNLSFFQPFDIVEVNTLHENYTEYSEIWEEALEGIFKYTITRQWNNFRSKIPPTTATLQGFESGIEINFTMPLNDESYPAESFIVIFENGQKEAVKFQFFVDGNYFVEFFKNRKNKINQDEELTLDYRVNDRDLKFVDGSALVSTTFFPPNVTLMNMYSLFGVETMLAMTLRAIEIKSGVEFKPNLSNIEHFTPIDFDLLVTSNDEYTPLWRKLLNLQPLKEEPFVKKNEEVLTSGTEGDVVTIVVDVKTIPEVTSPPESLKEVVSSSPNKVTAESEKEDTTVSPSFIEDENFSRKYDVFSPQDSRDSKVEERITPLFHNPLRFLWKSSRASQSSSKREIFSTNKEDKITDKIYVKGEEHIQNDKNNEKEFQLTEEKDVDLTKLLIETPFIKSITGEPSTTASVSKTVKKVDNQLEETVTVVSSIIVGNDNSEAIKVDSELTSVTESIPEEDETVYSTIVNSITETPENIEETTQTEKLTPHVEDVSSLLDPTEEDLQKDENDQVLGQREEHPRRFEESSDKNEIPITFKISFDSQDKTIDDSLKLPEFTSEDILPEDYSLLDEITDDLVDEILPPPHPICFTEGLVPDFYRCQVFYECVLQNGRWEVYNWRCKRGSYYDPAKIACIRGYC